MLAAAGPHHEDMTFWIIAAVVVVALGAVWLWADRRTTIRGSALRTGVDNALKNGEAQSTSIRHQAGGPTAGAGW